MGSSKTPAPPPAAEPLDIIDELSGYEQVKVTGADGKERFIRRALPLSPEQEALKLQYESIVNEQLSVIQKLSDPALASQIPEFQPALEAYRTQQELSLNKAVKARTRSESEALARSGIEDSTSAIQQRAITGRDVQAGQQAIYDNTALFGEQMRNDAINRSQNLLGIAQGAQNNQFTQGLQSLGQLQSTQQAMLGSQMNYNSQLFQSQVANAQAAQANKAALIGGAATIAGAVIGGPVGAGLGASLAKAGTGSNAFNAGTQSTITSGGIRLPAGLPRSTQ